jgi:carbamoyltransferase
MTVILGISHPISWNPAACLLVDGELVAMVEEERLNRKKHAPHAKPVLSIEYCLKTAGITIADVDVIAVGFGRPWESAWGQLLNGDLRLGWRLALRWLIELFRYEQ